MKVGKRLLSVLLSVVLVVGLCPGMAFAEGDSQARANNRNYSFGAGVAVSRVGEGEIASHQVSIAASQTEIEQVTLWGGATAAITSDGVLWMWGNYYFLPEDGSGEDWLIPVRVMDNVRTVTFGSYFGLALKNDGSLWAWGSDDQSFGDGYTKHKKPTKIMENVDKVIDDHAVIKSDGSLWAWGDCVKAAKGSKRAAKLLDNGLSFHQFGSWYYWWAAVTTDGSLWTWGANGNGQLGDGTTTNRDNPVEVMKNVIDVQAGSGHMLALRSDQSLWAWGLNDRGQLGNGSFNSSAAPIECMKGVSSAYASGRSTAALKEDGTFYAWGYSPWGAGGSSVSSTDTYSENPELVASDVVSVPGPGVVIKTDKTLYGWDYNQRWKTHPDKGFDKYAFKTVANNVASADFSDGYGYAIEDNGKLSSFKYNMNWNNGRDYSPDAMFTVEQVNLGNAVSVHNRYDTYSALCKDGSLYLWGDNYRGSIGDGTTVDKSVPTLVFSNGEWVYGYKEFDADAVEGTGKTDIAGTPIVDADLSGVDSKGDSASKPANSESATDQAGHIEQSGSNVANSADGVGSVVAVKFANPMKVKIAGKKALTLKASKLVRKAQKVKALKVTGAAGKVMYKKVSKSKALKKFKVNAKNGKVTVPRGTKKGIYKVKLKVTAAGNATHEPAVKTVMVKIRVK